VGREVGWPEGREDGSVDGVSGGKTVGKEGGYREVGVSEGRITVGESVGMYVG
jgi:hypothetical protein